MSDANWVRGLADATLDDCMRTSTETVLARFARAVLDALDERDRDPRANRVTTEEIRTAIARNMERKP